MFPANELTAREACEKSETKFSKRLQALVEYRKFGPRILCSTMRRFESILENRTPSPLPSDSLLPERLFKRCIQLLSQLTLLHSFRIRRVSLFFVSGISLLLIKRTPWWKLTLYNRAKFSRKPKLLENCFLKYLEYAWFGYFITISVNRRNFVTPQSSSRNRNFQRYCFLKNNWIICVVWEFYCNFVNFIDFQYQTNCSLIVLEY